MANLTLNAETELNLQMEAMTEETEGYCDEWNIRHKQLLENDQFLNKKIQQNDNAIAALGAAVIISATAPSQTANVLWVKPGGST